MNDKLSILMSNEQISANKLAKALGVQPSAISHILSGRNSPSYDFITKLLIAFPKYNAEWLLLGRGEMYTCADEIIQQKVTDVTISHPEVHNITSKRIIIINNDGTFEDYVK